MSSVIPPNKIKQKIKKLEPIICAFMRIPDPSIAEIMALCGVELIVIDCSHYQYNPETLVNVIRAADIYDISCLVRISEVNKERICRLLDMGAIGVLFTDAENAEQLKRVVDAVKYSPIGHRGVSRDSRGNRFGFLADIENHAEYFNDNTIIAVVVETKSAVEDLDEILAIPEIDIVSVGSADLSHAYGFPEDPSQPKLLELKKSIYKRIVASGKMALDKTPSLNDVDYAYEMGVRCFYITSDAVLIRKSLQNLIDPIKNKYLKS